MPSPSEGPSEDVASEQSQHQSDGDDNGTPPPPLPPRPSESHLSSRAPSTPIGTLQGYSKNLRPQLRTQATTAVSLTDIHTQTHQESLHETYSTSAAPPKGSPTPGKDGRESKSRWAPSGSDTGDTASIKSYVPTLETSGDVESLLGEVLGSDACGMSWLHAKDDGRSERPVIMSLEDQHLDEHFLHEFDESEELNASGDNEEALFEQWKSRLKHFLILSSAGKPIYSRHGDENVVSNYIGIIQTIISFYQGAEDPLKTFTAGGTRFVIVSEGPLYLVAISRLGESEIQLRAQLDALYMQILSTLTLPTLTHMFSNRPSTDLRRPLRGTETLLSALADTFTRGSAPTLLSALECLKLRKSQRSLINNILLKTRTPDLLYGLIVAGGRLVSVVRPKRHSLHPGDLQLIFNMLFEAGGVKAGGGENWIPLCLPGFNKKGYLYMYVSFLGKETEGEHYSANKSRSEDEVAVLLISANKESFYELQKMRDEVVKQLEKSRSMEIIEAAVQRGRPQSSDIVPGSVIRHFLYKSRANVQFVMPAFDPHFNTLLSRRRLLNLYHTLHTNVHAKTSHIKVQHYISEESVSLAWVTPTFELYCVAGFNVNRAALAKAANKITQWARREEERLFIIGGAVF
ncbi:MAG: Vacuolar fusion protein mon1 [Piccolia ochrophora]|nr:MAG: Vacuolar fusion protein mon1 [Piccolia ochrophora]